VSDLRPFYGMKITTMLLFTVFNIVYTPGVDILPPALIFYQGRVYSFLATGQSFRLQSLARRVANCDYNFLLAILTPEKLNFFIYLTR